MDKISYYKRSGNKLFEEKVPGAGFLRWLYNAPIGKLTLNVLFKRKMLSAVVGSFFDSTLSRNQVEKFVKSYNLDMSIYQNPEKGYQTFNEFFIRKIKPEARPVAEGIVSPADGKILAFQSLKDVDKFFVKGSEFDIKKYLLSDELTKKYSDCSMVIVRLAPTDYHRFHFPADGVISESELIKGYYYSVSPLALKNNLRIFCENVRTLSTLSTENYGDILISEVGATMVGSIIQTYKPDSQVTKGSEKGYFEFGGSTLVVLFEKNKIKIDEDLIKNTSSGYETEIRMGEKIAE